MRTKVEMKTTNFETQRGWVFSLTFIYLCFHLQHFVSERKYDEDLGKALRFTFDLEPLKTSIAGFGSGTVSKSSHLFLLLTCVQLCLTLGWDTPFLKSQNTRPAG